MYQTKSYQINSPYHIWEQFKQIHNDRNRANSRIIELLAEDVAKHTDCNQRQPELQSELDRVLGGDV